LHHEDVLARSFADLAALVEEDGFIEPTPLRVLHGSHGIDVLTARFSGGWHRIRWKFANRRDRHPYAVVEPAREIGAAREPGDRDAHGTFFRPHTERAGVEKRDRPQVRVFQLVDAHDVERGFRKLLR